MATNSTNIVKNYLSKQFFIDFFIFFVITFIIYFLVLKFIFPGYFSPLVPHHCDDYMFYPTSPKQTLDTLLMSPRFVGIFVRDIVGIFGMKGTMMFLVILNAINITLTILLVKIATKIKLYWPSIILYLFLIFSHPGFYINYSYDFFDVLSYFFVVSTVLIWYKIRERISWNLLLIIILFIFLSLFSKETYFIPLFIFWCYQYFYSDKKQKRPLLIILSVTLLLFVSSILHSHFINSPWVKIGNSGDNPYSININPSSIARTYFYYLKSWGNFGILGLIFISLVASIISKKYSKQIILFLAMGFSTYLPHSLLPNHKFSYYYWLAVPLTYTVILFINPDLVKLTVKRFNNKKLSNGLLVLFIFLVISLGILSFKKYNDSYNEVEPQWILQQESINRNMLATLPYIKNNVAPSDKILLAGLTFPFHPFCYPNYIDSYFGNFQNLKWIVVDYDNTNEDNSMGSIKFLGIKKIEIPEYDKIFVFSTEGKLIRKIEKGTAETERDVFLYPELSK